MRPALNAPASGVMVYALWEDIMKTTSRVLAVILFLASFTTLAVGQNRVVARLNVPFAFTAHNQDFEHGDYVLRQIGAQTVRCERNGVGITLLSPQGISDRDPVKLTFRVVGDRYFLASVTAPSFQITLPVSRVEVNLARSNKTRTVEIVAR